MFSSEALIFLFHSPTGSSIVVLSGREPSNQRPARSITFCHSVTSLPTASIHSAGFPWYNAARMEQDTVNGGMWQLEVEMWWLPVPKLNRTPPKNSLLASRSWFQTHNSKARSTNSWWLTSSKIRVLFHTGFDVRLLIIVLCLVVLPFSGSRVLWAEFKSVTASSN